MSLRTRYAVAERILRAAARHPAAIASVALLVVALFTASILRFRDGERGAITTLVGALLLHSALYFATRGRRADRGIVVTFALAGAIMRLVTIFAVEPDAFGDSIPRLLEDGRSLASGFDPKIFAPLDPRLDGIADRSTPLARIDSASRARPVVSPPLPLFAAAVLAKLPASDLLWRILAAGAEVGVLVLLFRSRADDDRDGSGRFLLIVAHPLWIAAFWGAARPEVFAILAAFAAVRAFLRSRERTAILWAAAGCAATPLFFLPLIAAVWRRPIVAKRFAACTAAALLVVTFIPIDLQSAPPAFRADAVDVVSTNEKKTGTISLDAGGGIEIVAEGVDWRGVASVDRSGRIDGALNRMTSSCEGVISTDRKLLVLSSRSLDTTVCAVPEKSSSAARSIEGRWMLLGTPPSTQPKRHGLVYEIDGRGAATTAGKDGVTFERSPSGRLRFIASDGPVLGEGELRADGTLIDMRTDRGGFVLARLRPSAVATTLFSLDRAVPNENPVQRAAVSMGSSDLWGAVLALVAAIGIASAIGAFGRSFAKDAASAAAWATLGAIAIISPMSPILVAAALPLFLVAELRVGIFLSVVVGIARGFGGGEIGPAAPLYELAFTVFVVILPAVDFRALLRRPRPTS